ncbi:hypothetical protein AVEN_45179-1, partial [Araneus ventricosus]
MFSAAILDIILFSLSNSRHIIKAKTLREITEVLCILIGNGDPSDIPIWQSFEEVR